MGNRMTYAQAQNIRAYTSMYPGMLVNEHSKRESDWILSHFDDADDYNAFIRAEEQMIEEEQARRDAEHRKRQEALKQLLGIDFCRLCGHHLDDCQCWDWNALI